MILAMIASFAMGGWLLGLAVLGAFVINHTLLVYLFPWRHPTVPLWKLLSPILGFQFVLVAAAIMLFESNRSESMGLMYETALMFFLPFTLMVWHDWLGSTVKPKPVAAELDELA